MKRKISPKKRLRFEALEGRQMLSAVTVLPAGGGIAAEAASAHYLSPAAQTVSHSAAVTDTQSYNWGGYAVSAPNGSVNSVTGSWTVPSVSGTKNTYSALWVGIDGFNDSTVEQLGTEQDVINGVPTYSAWWEMYPNGSNDITLSSGKPFQVAPGDAITASVTYQPATKRSGADFLLTISDTTEKESFTTTQPMARGYTAERSSAEWIVEAPCMGNTILPLADFNTASFSGASATLESTPGPIDNGWAKTFLNSINIISNSGAVIETTGATTAAPNGALTDNAGTSSFAVTYDAPTTPVTPTPPAPNPPSSHHHGGGGWGGDGGGWGFGWGTRDVSQITIGLADQTTDSAHSDSGKDALRAIDGIFASADWLSLQAVRV